MQADLEVPFRAIADTTPDAVLVCEPTGRLLLVNAEAERMFGYTAAELIGHSIDILVPNGVRARHHKLMASYTAAPKVRLIGQSHLELHARRKDGSEFPVEISLSPFHTEFGTVVIGAVRDISERRELESELRLANAHLVSAIEAVRDPFIMLDPDGRILRANHAAIELLGTDLVGRELEAVMHAAIVQRMFELPGLSGDEIYARWLAYHRTPHGTFELRTASGRYLRLTDRRTADGGSVITFVDLTDLLEARELAEAASAAKSEFLSSMSHELRTPLNAILGFAALLAQDRKRPLDERQLERLGHVIRGGEHLLRLVDDVLDLSRIEDGRLAVAAEPVDIAAVVAQAARSLDPMAERAKIEIEVAPPPPAMPNVIADRTRLLQILMNFGSNAIKYGREGGHVVLRIEPHEGRVRIAVSDDGIGIADDKRAKIFAPFERAGQETGPIEGTGIGLTISRRLAELMHATIDFTSMAGRGSTFWIDLPVERGPSAAHETTPFVLPDSPLTHGPARYRVLYVEDNLSSAALMRELAGELAALDLEVVATAEEGLAAIATRRPHLVLLDINLPGMSGFEAAARLRADPAMRALRIVGVSAAALAADTAQARELGFDGYLTKPILLAELARKLAELLP